MAEARVRSAIVLGRTGTRLPSLALNDRTTSTKESLKICHSEAIAEESSPLGSSFSEKSPEVLHAVFSWSSSLPFVAVLAFPYQARVV